MSATSILQIKSRIPRRTPTSTFHSTLTGLPVTVCIVQELIRGCQFLTKSGRTMDTVAPVSTINDVGLPSANPLTVSYTHLDVYKRQVLMVLMKLCLVGRVKWIIRNKRSRLFEMWSFIYKKLLFKTVHFCGASISWKKTPKKMFIISTYVFSISSNQSLILWVILICSL